MRGIQFLDEKDNEIVKWTFGGEETWQTKELPDGFEIIGVYGDTRAGYDVKFGFLIWNPKPSKSS